MEDMIGDCDLRLNVQYWDQRRCVIERQEMSTSESMLIIFEWWCELARRRVLSFTIMPRRVVWGSTLSFSFIHRSPSRASGSSSGHCKRYSTSESSRRKKKKNRSIFFKISALCCRLWIRHTITSALKRNETLAWDERVLTILKWKGAGIDTNTYCPIARSDADGPDLIAPCAY